MVGKGEMLIHQGSLQRLVLPVSYTFDLPLRHGFIAIWLWYRCTWHGDGDGDTEDRDAVEQGGMDRRIQCKLCRRVAVTIDLAEALTNAAGDERL